MRTRKVFALTFLLCLLCSAPSHAARARVLFIGDIMVHRQQLEAAERRGASGERTWDFAPQFRRVRPLLADAFVVGNLETVLAGPKGKKGGGYTGYPLFNTPDSLADALKDLGVDLLTLANNHILDQGTSGARRTAEVLDRQGIPWTGLGLGDVPANDAILLEAEGLRWAFVNYTYGSNLPPRPAAKSPTSDDIHLNTISEPAIAEGMTRAKALSPDVIVACFHWGSEYHYVPSDRQRRAADQALDLGAHLVIGTHPHVLQPVDVRLGEDGEAQAVAWSLGNFVSFQRTLPRERTCILSAEFERGEDGRTRLIRLAAAPLQVILVPNPRMRRTEVVYAGTGGNFNHAGLSRGQLRAVRRAGRAVLDFLGAQDEVDEQGFYTLWTAASPDILPSPRLRAPLN